MSEHDYQTNLSEAAAQGPLPPAEKSRALAAEYAQTLLRARLIDVIAAAGQPPAC